MKSILITGAQGVIGSSRLFKYLSNTYNVIGIVKNNPKRNLYTFNTIKNYKKNRRVDSPCWQNPTKYSGLKDIEILKKII